MREVFGVGQRGYHPMDHGLGYPEPGCNLGDAQVASRFQEGVKNSGNAADRRGRHFVEREFGSHSGGQRCVGQ